MKTLFRSLVPARMRETRRRFAQLSPRAQWLLAVRFFERILGLIDMNRLPREIGSDALVLFVCQGNLFRSPLAEAAFAREASRKHSGPFRHLSAGLRARGGHPAPAAALVVASELGLSLEQHSTTPLTAELVARADLIVVMDFENDADLLAQFPAARDRVVMLGAFEEQARKNGISISDPYGQATDVVRECYGRIERAVAGLHDRLTRHASTHHPRLTSPIHQLRRRLLTAAAANRLWRPFTSGVTPIFTLHRFADPDEGIRGHDPQILDQILNSLRGTHVNLLSLGEWVAHWRNGEPVPARSVVFTVDDGYADFARIGLPIFARYDCPVTQFLVTDPVDGDGWFWWDRVYYAMRESSRRELRLDLDGTTLSFTWKDELGRTRAQRALIDRLKLLDEASKRALIERIVRAMEVEIPPHPPTRYRPISWDEVRRAGGSGASFGAHTVTHPRLSACSDTESNWQIMRSIERVRKESDAFVPIFCYPYGDAQAFTARSNDALVAAGMEGAVTTIPGFASAFPVNGVQPAGRFAIPRYSLPDEVETVMQICSGLERAYTVLKRFSPVERRSKHPLTAQTQT